MKRTKGALRALSPKRTREHGGSFDDTNAPAPASSFTSPGGQRHSGRGRFSLGRKQRPYQDLPEPVQSEEDFQKEWGLPRSVEEERLVELRRAVEATAGPLKPAYDRFYLRRFLRARQHDVARATAMLLAHLAWRKDMGVDSLLEDFFFQERDAFLSLYPQGYHKTDKLGRPIYIQHLGQIDLRALMEVTTEDRMVRFHVQEYERALRYIFPACSKVQGRHIGQTLAILDLKGVGLRHLTGDVKRVLARLTSIDQDNYPETLGKTLIINAPAVFKLLWGVVRPMLDVRTQAKIEVCPSNYLPVLLRWVDAENIPEYLGGKSKGSLIEDVGPWQDAAIHAEIDADIAHRDGVALPATPPEGLGATAQGGSPPGTPGAARALPPPPRLLSDFSSGTSSEGAEQEHGGGQQGGWSDALSRAASFSTLPASAYASADEEGPASPRSATSPGARAPRRERSAEAAAPLVQVAVDGTHAAAPAAAEAQSAEVAAGAAGLGPGKQISLLARVRSLEEAASTAERPLRHYLGGGGAVQPSKALGQGTLLDRVAKLERAMDLLLRAQEQALHDAPAGQRAAAPGPRRRCCGACSVM